MVSKLLPLLPPHHTYVEPFGGGASLLFAKAPAPVEVYNDLDSDVVNFYRVLRDPALFTRFVTLCEFTPYSRLEWQAARAARHHGTDPAARAWRWFVWVRQQFGGGGQTGGGWQLVTTETAAGMSSNVANWLAAVRGLPAVHARLRTVQIEGTDWRPILVTYDSPATLFYCDPPYVQATRGRHRYTHDFTEADHAALVDALLACQGAVVLSGYAHPVYSPLEAAGWRRVSWETTACTVVGRAAPRQECAWLSPVVADYGPLFTGGLA